MCVYTNLISTSIHDTRNKTKKKPCQEQEIKLSRITAQGKKKKIMGQKERKGQHRPTPWKKARDTQSVVKRKPKTLRECCNDTITKVLNRIGANYKINQNRESKRWNFSRRFSI